MILTTSFAFELLVLTILEFQLSSVDIICDATQRNLGVDRTSLSIYNN